MRNRTEHFVNTMMEKNPARQPRKKKNCKKKASGALALALAPASASALAPAPASALVFAPSSKAAAAAAKPPSPTVANVVVANVSATTMPEAETETETAETNAIKIKNSADGQKLFEWLDCVKAAGGFTVRKDDADATVDENIDMATSYEAFRDCIKRVLAGANLCLPAGSGYNPEKWLRKPENFEGFDFSIGVQAATATATTAAAATAAAAAKVRICFVFVLKTPNHACVCICVCMQAQGSASSGNMWKFKINTSVFEHEVPLPRGIDSGKLSPGEAAAMTRTRKRESEQRMIPVQPTEVETGRIVEQMERCSPLEDAETREFVENENPSAFKRLRLESPSN